MSIVVTGAAGSIGSAVCRELAAFGEQLVLVDIDETALFWLEGELAKAGGNVKPVICSVADEEAIVRLITQAKPSAVIHCAALKHVRLSDLNLCEAVKVNVAGTTNVATAAAYANARMVLVSTDKAVEPTTVMGATKKAAEMAVSTLADVRVVRLVNILGTAGSLTQVVQRQIEAGEPVFVTSKEMRRYFMSIEAAVRLIISQLALPLLRRGTVTVPAGVEERRVVDVIQEMIDAAGRAVTIIETQPQANEKLSELRLTALEASRARDVVDPPSQVFDIRQADFETARDLRLMIRMARDGDERGAYERLFSIGRR